MFKLFVIGTIVSSLGALFSGISLLGRFYTWVPVIFFLVVFLINFRGLTLSW